MLSVVGLIFPKQESAPLLTTRITASLATPGLDLVQEDNMIPITPVETRLLLNRIMAINTLKPWVRFWFIETKIKTRKLIQMLRLDSERFSKKICFGFLIYLSSCTLFFPLRYFVNYAPLLRAVCKFSYIVCCLAPFLCRSLSWNFSPSVYLVRISSWHEFRPYWIFQKHMPHSIMHSSL